MEEFSNGSHLGFIRAPQSTYVPKLAEMMKGSNCNWLGNIKNTWCCDAVLNWTKLLPQCHGNRWELNCVKIAVGDRFRFKINMEKKTCEVFHNGKNLGVIFKDLPTEISPAISSTAFAHKGEIRFVDGRRV